MLRTLPQVCRIEVSVTEEQQSLQDFLRKNKLDNEQGREHMGQKLACPIRLT